MCKKTVVLFSNLLLVRVFQLFLVIFILTSCESEKNNEDQPKTFFDLKGFIEGQITELNLEKPVVSKSMAIGKERSRLSSKEINWKKELELFIQADINKPAYKNSYNVIHDSLTYEYVVKSDEQIPVRHLKIKLDRPEGVPIAIEALLISENKLYKSEKRIDLSCVVEHNKSRVISYRIEGFQKLIMMDQKPFEIEANVKH